MSRSTRTSTVLALAIAAVLPVAAHAETQDLRSPDTRDAAVSSTSGKQDLRSPDARDAARGPVVTHQDLRSPDTRDAADGVPYGQAPIIVPAPVGVPAGGFDWGDAGIGAAGGIALLTLFGGLGSLAVHRRRSTGLAH